MTGPDDRDLRLLLRSPALDLEPPPGLADAARAGARRARRLRRSAAALATVAVVGLGVAVAPAASTWLEELQGRSDDAPTFTQDKAFPDATSDIVTMRTVGGAQVVTWYEGDRWCTAPSRAGGERACAGPVRATDLGLPRYLDPDAPSMRISRWSMASGLAGSDVARVRLHMVDGREFESEVHEGRGFVLRAWSALITGPVGDVAYVAGYDALGREVARRAG